jgi:hypothetical protein
MPKLTLKKLLLCAILVAVSIWLAMQAIDRIRSLLNPGPAPYMQLVVAGSMFGAGIFAPFARFFRGAIFGSVATVAYLYFR